MCFVFFIMVMHEVSVFVGKYIQILFVAGTHSGACVCVSCPGLVGEVEQAVVRKKDIA